MAIAFDAQSASAYSGTTTCTWSHTCTGSDRILLVGVYDGANRVTGVTYNGVAMTQIDDLAMTGAAAGQHIRLFYLINPATGANNCVITSSSNNDMYGAGSSYTGTKQSGQPDAHNTNVSSSTTSLTTSVTTVADNCWLVGLGYGQTATAGAGTVFRGEPVNDNLFMMDANGVTTPAGSDSLIFTQAANFAGACVASVSPVAAAAATSDPMFMGAAF